MMRTRSLVRPVLIAASAVAVTALTACAPSPADAACAVLRDDSAVAAVVFTAAIPGMTERADVAARIELMDRVDDVPAELADAWKQWHEYLELALETTDAADFSMTWSDYKAAGDTLSDFYTGTCL